ncbi:MAG TPA: GNAT family N-acetyltransferase [Clostridia bacterium]|nr:GNAT family N-acetyltransferase [Clostridia bacterium]
MLRFDPFPVLETDNLILRKMSPDDKDDFFAIRSDEKMHLFTDTRPDQDVSQTEQYLNRMISGVEEHRWIIWTLEHRELHHVIGSIGIWNFNEAQTTAELSYGIAPDFQGKGYMKEALSRVITFAVDELRLDALEAYTERENTPSRKLLERLHFSEAGQVDDVSADGTRVYHMFVYRLER